MEWWRGEATLKRATPARYARVRGGIAADAGGRLGLRVDLVAAAAYHGRFSRWGSLNLCQSGLREHGGPIIGRGARRDRSYAHFGELRKAQLLGTPYKTRFVEPWQDEVRRKPQPVEKVGAELKIIRKQAPEAPKSPKYGVFGARSGAEAGM